MVAISSLAPSGPALHAAPKVLLHEHLDGGLRPETLFELCRTHGIEIPARDSASLAQWMHDNADSASLVRYLRGFATTCAGPGVPGTKAARGSAPGAPSSAIRRRCMPGPSASRARRASD